MSLPPLLTQHMVRRPQRIALLQHIAEQGSITRAAKSAGLSYKAAWDAIDELNNLAQKPLVERSVGGRGGGGAKLSVEGERVLRLYQRVQTLQAQILEAAEDSSDLDLLNRLTLRTSARNQLLGRIVSITRQGHHDQVRLQLADEVFIDAQVTHDSTLHLGLEIGTDAVALIKAGWLELHAQSAKGAKETNGNNCLTGQIDSVIDAEDGPSEVRITLPSGQTLCALATPQQLHAQQLQTGVTVQARFAASFVLLGIPS
ncbi:TOBE domain-containing protein [Pseudomonas syringae]|uniref:LysR family transcriptional regulator n=2 Tax=Pseudomonas syringae TaxID=317 RepID=A0A9Q4A7X9_PSESX|nr:TOBE domain-containing protein [Pseudomonas syringae]MCF5469141.1 LysR family transcriptional regulator [Pseudomonas syringae]MCF5473527.1 LysR family transcriptional regulator [Pseudomonas syringae]MCF5483566.1 LysR family transcriptional regulator [Pseudomonas syringae]MCF5488895.1 LysR family transcriptional regulator [Pseudomonas syringae]MCF5493704.1 LysR family transcriptional regulator [Pseudomonas syringae]